jgi:hypothetical protein
VDEEKNFITIFPRRMKEVFMALLYTVFVVVSYIAIAFAVNLVSAPAEPCAVIVESDEK